MEPDDKQGGVDAGMVEGHFYADGPPLSNQFGTEGALSITRGRLDDDDLMVCATLRQTWPGDVVRREAAHFGTLAVASQVDLGERRRVTP
jgi:hypothetical protein